MAFGWTKHRYSPIGVDFGADSLKLLQVIPSDPPQLIAAAATHIPDELRNDPDARTAFVGQALRDLLRQQPFKGRRAVCSIPAYQTLVQHLQISRSEVEDFQAQIGLQLRQRLNVDPARMVIRHFSVGPVVREGGSKQEVICVAASRESIMRHIETAHRAKLDVVGMHDEPSAILRAFGHLYRSEQDSQRTTCFIDLGAATTKVVVAHGREMAFAKTIHAAGDHQTREVAQARNISLGEARAARIAESGQREGAGPESRAGLAMLDAQIVAQKPAAEVAHAQANPDRDAPTLSADTLDCLIDELHLCVRYHNSMFPNRAIEKLVFLGGESRHVANCQRIARALRIGAQLGDPLARLVQVGSVKQPDGVDLRQPQPGWAVPLGLCLFEGEKA